MPDSLKIWGTLELEKQGDSCRGTSRPQARTRLDPREVRSWRVARERRPVEPGARSPPVGNQPINTSY